MSNFRRQINNHNQAISLDLDDRGRLNLGKNLDYQYLTKRELDILKFLI